MPIVPYQPEYAPYFDRFNRAWIEQYYTIEPFDHEVLTNPQDHILAHGGELWFAQENNAIVGACALLVLEPGMFEFTKLGVDEAARGKGVARALLRHCIQRAKDKQAHTLRIFTGSMLIPARTLYKSEGFVEKPMTPEQRARYKRADVMLDLALS